MKRKLFKLTIMMSILFLLSVSAAQTHAMNNTEGIDPQAATLTIATRHDATLYNLYANAFLDSDYASDAGITSVTFRSPSTFDAFHTYMSDPSYGVSMGWGGGPTVFTNLAQADVLLELNEANTDAELMALIDEAVPESIAGAAMRYYDGSKLLWVANAISSFGFTINLDYLNENGLPIPTTWEDLASPEFMIADENTIAMGNAPLTTSNTRIYQIIVQKYGWELGWQILTRMAGNGGIYGESVPTRSAVINKEVGVSMTIDFYGLIAQSENDKCLYVVPTNGSIVNGDPIVIAKEAPNLPGAIAFMKFVNTQEGQSLWLDPSINRLPIRADAFDTVLGQTRDDIYEVYNSTITNIGIEFDEDLAMSWENSLIWYFDAAITTPHVYLKSAWTDLVEDLNDGLINETEFDEQAAILTSPDLSQAEAIEINTQMSSTSFKSSKVTSWTTLAKTRFGIEPTTTDPTDTSDDDENAFSFGEVALFAFVPMMIAIVRKHKNKK
ncbi:MAG: ABC transporter substrate-binding protein [Candidatus Kariarchaeaceae archaeon]